MRFLQILLALLLLTGCASMRRQAYVDARPKMAAAKRADILAGNIWVGATAKEVRASWGIPRRVNRTTTGGGRSEQWVYGRAPHSVYVYFDGGRVTGWQD